MEKIDENDTNKQEMNGSHDKDNNKDKDDDKDDDEQD